MLMTKVHAGDAAIVHRQLSAGLLSRRSEARPNWLAHGACPWPPWPAPMRPSAPAPMMSPRSALHAAGFKSTANAGVQLRACPPCAPKQQRIVNCPAPGITAGCTRTRFVLSVALCCLLPSLKTSMRAAMRVVVDGTCANPLEGPPSRERAPCKPLVHRASTHR